MAKAEELPCININRFQVAGGSDGILVYLLDQPFRNGKTYARGSFRLSRSNARQLADHLNKTLDAMEAQNGDVADKE